MRQPIGVMVLALFMLLGRASAGSDPQASEAQRLQGTWKLLSYVGEEVPGGRRADVMGPRPAGYIHYGPDGRMMVIIVGTDRRKPVGPVATPAEATALLDPAQARSAEAMVLGRAGALTRDGLAAAKRAVLALRDDAAPLPDQPASLADQYRTVGDPAVAFEVSGEVRPIPAQASVVAYRTAPSKPARTRETGE